MLINIDGIPLYELFQDKTVKREAFKLFDEIKVEMKKELTASKQKKDNKSFH